MIHLTPREKQILRSRAGGHTNKEIAGELGLTLRTVKWHLTGVFIKLDARNIVDCFLKLGWLEVPDEN